MGSRLIRRRSTARGSLALIALLVGACDAPENVAPSIVTTPPTVMPQPRQGPTKPNAIEEAPVSGDDGPPPPWPEITVIAGRFSPEWARDYVAQVRADREAFDAELASRTESPKTAAQAAHQRIHDNGRRARLMNRPTLETITDEEIADFISFNPTLASGEKELARLLEAHPDSLQICIDHGRWLLFRHERSAAMAEYARCARTPGISEDQLRYVTTQMAAARNSK